MPEGPEAFYLSNKINKEFKNKSLNSIKILKGRYVKHGVPDGYTNFVKDLP
jgi:hypothetical protein